MFLRWLKKRNSENIIGLDINADAIKLIAINHNQTPFEITHFALTRTPPGAIVKDEIKDPAAITNLLRDMVRRSGFTSQFAALAISRSSAIIKNVQVDSRLNASELESRAWIEATRYFPDLVEDIYLDFNITDSPTQDPTQRELILVACRKDQIKPYVEVTQQSGLIPKIVDVNCYALERILAVMTKDISDTDAVALLNLNFSLSSLIVSQQNNMIYAHDHGYDGLRLITQVKKFLNLEDKDIDPSLPITDALAYETLLRENLSSHLRHTMHFFLSSRPNITIKKIILCGDCAVIPALNTFIQKETNIETEIGNPIATMKINPAVDETLLKTSAPTLALCCGLALSTLD